MRNLALGFLLVVIAAIFYTVVAKRAKRVTAARDAFFTECDRLDITHPEGEQFMEYLESKSSEKPKRNIEFYGYALNELKKRVTTPRSISRDRRAIELIEPK